MTSRQNSEKLVNQMETFIENVRQINIMVCNFQPQAQHILNRKIQNIVTDLQVINNLKDSVKDMRIPVEVLKYVDAGQNPHLFTKDCIDKAMIKNQELKGKIDSYKKFKANMLLEINKYFPKEVEKYRAIRNDNNDD
ncbi:PREDICTED: mediator of RNA polymerase II transcription subunit 10 [Ceratosolen solmsi marchali]|uniref:Mediator of RNA polymerase II transcription subunit 10 n=1 Tax=Ceratosolen solmsi marchali TaxID=326594 RepID=A0AAJ6YNH4_9HYME|nr:PREDICTED: mediator of RNA polymerase II transcription subunit 10 [Ceratosolen solmsi marchali]